jgi:hypothetical protein
MIKNTSLFFLCLFFSNLLYGQEEKKVEVVFSKEEFSEYVQRRGLNSFKYSLEYYNFSFTEYRSPVNSEILENNYQKSKLSAPAISLSYALNFNQSSLAFGFRYIYNKINGTNQETTTVNSTTQVITNNTTLDASMIGVFSELNLDLFSDYYIIPYGELGFNQMYFAESIGSRNFSTEISSIINMKIGFKIRLSSLDKTAYRDGHREYGLTEAFFAVFANQQSAGTSSSTSVASSFQPGFSLQLEY